MYDNNKNLHWKEFKIKDEIWDSNLNSSEISISQNINSHKNKEISINKDTTKIIYIKLL